MIYAAVAFVWLLVGYWLGRTGSRRAEVRVPDAGVNRCSVMWDTDAGEVPLYVTTNADSGKLMRK